MSTDQNISLDEYVWIHWLISIVLFLTIYRPNLGQHLGTQDSYKTKGTQITKEGQEICHDLKDRPHPLGTQLVDEGQLKCHDIKEARPHPGIFRFHIL